MIRPTYGRPLLGAAATLALVGALAGCYDAGTGDVDSPGTNLRVDDLAIRYAHLEDDAGAGHDEGADVPLYLWLVNEGEQPVEVAGITSPLTGSVVLTEGQLPLVVPPRDTLQLGPEGQHAVLEDIERDIRGSEFVTVELAFGDGREVEFDVEAVKAFTDRTPTVPPPS